MKSVFLILTVIVYGQAFACDKKIDPSKVILFIDTNTSEPEIDRAEKAACARGEKLIIVPENFKMYKKIIDDHSKAEKELDSCIKKNGRDKCEAAQEKASKTYNDLEEFNQKKGLLPDQTEKALEEIRNTGGKIQTMIISGHDGGGKFGGLKGSFDKNDMKQLMDQFSDINEVKSLLLLGCYTGVQKEILDWKSIFPQIALIGGYDGSAPLAHIPAGHQYLTDLLMKGQSMIEEAKKKNINDYAKKNLSTLLNLNAAVYLQCGDDNNFYYSAKSRDLGFNQFNMKACENITKLKEIEAALAKYNNGDSEPPKDTAQGDLRKIYNDARALEHCFESKNINVDVSRVFNLLFYNGVKQSFAHFYKTDLKEAEDVLKSLDYQALKDAILADLSKNESDRATLIYDQKRMEENLPLYIEAKKKEAEETQRKKEATFAFLSKEAKSAISMGDQIDFMKLQSLNPKDTAALNEYQKQIYAAFTAKAEYEGLAKNPEGSLNSMKLRASAQEKKISALKGFVAGLTGKKEDLKKVWIPTQENLLKKTRKEFLENQHVLSYALSLKGLSEEQKNSLYKAHNAAQTHLVYFQNPFSWHEYNGRKVDNPFDN